LPVSHLLKHALTPKQCERKGRGDGSSRRGAAI
jgi:hypothetical protein